MPRILVADDNTNIQKMVALALGERGIDVVSVGNGEAAVRRIPDVSPDLVLADVFMPVRNGYEVCEFVKKDSRFAHVPVILLVGAFDPLDEKEARRVGADGVLKKPFVPPDPLIAMVTSALEKNPKLAAELAKAREVVPEAPLPAIMEIPAKAEPKPLPHFPEPTAEEAALIYGFGTGKRSSGRKDTKAAEEPAPAPQPEAVAEEEFESSLTANDWRRTSNEIEIPEEMGGSLAFSVDSEFESSIFPSEQDVPPARVRNAEAPEASVPDGGDSSFFVEQADASIKPSAAVEAEPQLAVPSPINSELEPAPGTSSPARPGKWMEMMSASHSEYSDDNWLKSAGSEAATPDKDSLASTQQEAVRAVGAESNLGSEGFFADSSDAPASSDSPATVAAESWFAPPPPLTETPVNAPTPAGSGSPISFADDLVTEAAEEPASIDPDPALVRPPAVQVTPEPLLVDDQESRDQRDYGSAAEEMTPLHSFLNAQKKDDSELEIERTPTVPPPDREAIAAIPFLAPPPAVPAAVLAQSPAVDEETVNAVVRQVLEKLEPQLHELLAQGMVKPLVENMLQTAKKEK